MSWCDKLASTPLVGFRIEWRFLPPDVLLNCMQPILNRNVAADKQAFSLDQYEAFAVTASTDDGYTYQINSSSVSVGFNHRMRPKIVSAGPPTMELVSRAIPYTDNLPTCAQRMQELLMLIGKVTDVKIRRVGIVAKTQIEPDLIPPGLAEMLDNFSAPWGNIVPYNIKFAAPIKNTEEARDRCHFNFILGEESESLMTLQLDWQRIFEKPVDGSERNVGDVLRLAQRDALDYFERAAEGKVLE